MATYAPIIPKNPRRTDHCEPSPATIQGFGEGRSRKLSARHGALLWGLRVFRFSAFQTMAS